MGFYENHILPKLINFACGMKAIQRQRAKVVPLAEGRILEVGMGSGLNLPFYNPAKVERVIGLDPADAMMSYARKKAAGLPFEVEYLALEGEHIPLDKGSVDTVLVTYTLCTIPDVLAALDGMRRVLRRDGRLIFCEHGKAPDPSVRRWQRRINPVWRKAFGGCNLDRDIPDLLAKTGFAIDRIDTGYLPRAPKFAAYNYWGVARPG